MIDIQREDRIFQPLSKNEQREYLGKMIISSLKESISAYPKMATSKQRAGLLYEVEQWMGEHSWLHGVIEQARLLLKAGSGTYEVSEQLHLSLDEVEDLYLSQYGIEHRKELHPDNVSEGKAGSFIE